MNMYLYFLRRFSPVAGCMWKNVHLKMLLDNSSIV